MPKYFHIKQLSIGKRLLLICLFIICAFCVNVGIMLSASENIQELTNTIISENVEIVLQNSQVTRELSRILSETNLYVTTFHLNPGEDSHSRIKILDSIEKIMDMEMEDELSKHLLEFRSVLIELFSVCNEINQQLLNIQQLNALTLTLFEKLEEHITQMIVQLVLDGEESLAYEQVGAIIPSYREMLTKVSLTFSTFKPTSNNSKEAKIIEDTLSILHLRLRTLLASDIKISSLGQSLMYTVKELSGIFSSVWKEQNILTAKLADLNKVQKRTLKAIDETDIKTKNAAELINQNINNIASTSALTIAFLSFIVALIVGGMTFFFLHYLIRRPMELLKGGIHSVSEGKLDTRVSLGRNDEWKIIETAINKMIAELANSHKKLQLSNFDLSNLNKQLRDRSISLEMEIGHRKKAESALTLSEERYRRFFNEDLSGSFIASPEGHLLACNPSFRKMFRLSDNALKETFSLHDIFSDTKAADDFFNSLKAQRTLKFVESDFSRHDDSVLSATATITGTFAGEGTLLEIKGQFIDETTRIEAERKSIKLEEQLEHARKMEAIGTLAGGVAHDLNNILTGVVSYPDLLLTKMESDHPFRKSILTIQESGKKAAAIVQDLLTLAKRGIVAKEIVDINQVINDYISTPEFSQMISHNPGVEILLDLSEDLKNIEGAPFHLTKTIMNLVSNAAESIEKQGTVTIKTATQALLPPEAKILNIAPGEYAIISVTDDGEGIDDENKSRIFEPFFSKKEMGRSGTGLGLAVVWGTVQDLGGHIELSSVKGEGTTFTIYLPITKKVLNETNNYSEKLDYQGRGEKILIVDDNNHQRQIASEILYALNYNADTVASGEEAVDFLKNHDADCLLLDMIMAPGIDGLDTYKRILEFKPSQQAIITSGYAETNRVKEAQQLGAKIYLRKPYTMEQLGLALKKGLLNN